MKKLPLAMAVALLATAGFGLSMPAQTAPPFPSPATIPSAIFPATQSTISGVGEKVPSDDPVLKDFHSLGLVDGKTDIFRCACPVRDLAKGMPATQPSDELLTQAEARMQRIYNLGIRTVISLQDPGVTTDTGEGKSNDEAAAVILEKAAAEKVGLTFLNRPISNAGPNSLETMSDQDAMKLADDISSEIFKDAATGGVAFHCTAGHDRTGFITAYIRLKYQHWPVDQAIDEMRRYGHNWVRFSSNGGISSWHEDHLRAIAKLLADN